MDSDEGESSKLKLPKRQSFTIAQKIAIVEYASRTSGAQAARIHGVAEASIRDWKHLLRETDEEDLCRMAKRRRKVGGGRKPLCEELDRQVLAWIESERSQNHRVIGDAILEKAKQVHAKLLVSKPAAVPPKFVASRGWLCNFCSRNAIALSGRATKPRKKTKKGRPSLQELLAADSLSRRPTVAAENKSSNEQPKTFRSSSSTSDEESLLDFISQSQLSC